MNKQPRKIGLTAPGLLFLGGIIMSILGFPFPEQPVCAIGLLLALVAVVWAWMIGPRKK